MPALPGALACLESGVLNRAHHTNAQYVQEHVRYDGVSDALRWLTVDPQTSGGLLLAVPAEDAARVVGRLRARFPVTERIGVVVEAPAAGVARLEVRG